MKQEAKNSDQKEGLVEVVMLELALEEQKGDGRIGVDRGQGQVGSEVWKGSISSSEPVGTLTLDPELGPDTGSRYHLIADGNLQS